MIKYYVKGKKTSRDLRISTSVVKQSIRRGFGKPRFELLTSYRSLLMSDLDPVFFPPSILPHRFVTETQVDQKKIMS